MFEDNRLAAQSQPQNPADVWNNRPASLPASNVTSHSSNGGFARAIMEDGKVVSVDTFASQSLTSTRTANEAQNAAANVPYATAVDPVTRCRVSPDQVKDDTILSFPGRGEVTARDARMLGWLSPALPAPQQQQSQPQENGSRFYDASADQPKQEVHPELAAEAFQNKDAEQTLDTIVANTGGFEQMSAIKEIVEGGEIGERTLNALATQLQVEPAKLQEGFAPVIAEFERQGRAVFSAGGLDADEVIAYAQQHKPDALNIAMHKHATQRSTAGYAAIRTAFLASLGETNPQRALTADLGPGVTSYQDAKGRVMVRVPGMGEMAWRQAIEAFGPK